MTVNSRAKGRAAEQAAARWLTENGWPTKRRLAGNGQAGDLMIADAPDVVVDVKARKQLAIPAWLDQLTAEADGRPHMALIVKVDGVADPGRWLAVWPGEFDDFDEVYAQPAEPFVGVWRDRLMDKPTVSAVLGWLTLEDAWTPSAPRVGWDGWRLSFAESWIADVLPKWGAA